MLEIVQYGVKVFRKTLLASYETVGKYCSSQPKRLAQLRSFTGAIYSETTITLNEDGQA